MEVFNNSRAVVLDDDSTTRETLTSMVRGWGFAAESFAQPEPALEHIKNAGCDIVLLAILASAAGVLELIPQLNENSKVIVITEPMDREIAVRTLELGAFNFLEKPFENDLLWSLITHALTVLQNERKLETLKESLEKSRLELLVNQRRLEKLNFELFETNRALSVFARNIDREREEMENQIALKLRNLLMPIITKLRNDPALHGHGAYLDMLTYHLENLTSASAIEPSIAMALSPAEMQIASLVKSGLSTDEIARRLRISGNTVHSHRRNIRRKLKINAQYNLRNFLDSKAGLRSVGEAGGTVYANRSKCAGSCRYN
jgi:FixJ family two-component response regulator